MISLESNQTLDRSRSRWRMVAVGAIGVLAGAVLAGSVAKEQAPTEVAAIIIQNDKSSGRWDATLIAVMQNGDIMYLDTSRSQTTWAPFKYSPGFNRPR